MNLELRSRAILECVRKIEELISLESLISSTFADRREPEI